MIFSSFIIKLSLMLKSRNTRLNTDYSRYSNSLVAEKHHKQTINSQKRVMQLSEEKQSQITKMLKSINHEVKYDRLTDDEIKQERENLKQKLKDMNAVIAKMIERQYDKRNISTRISKKANITEEMGLDYENLCKQYIKNNNKIFELQEQFAENNEKLTLLSDPDAKMTCARRIASCQVKIKELKQQLTRIRKNKFMRQKEIVKGCSKESEDQSLQFEYIACSKKLQNLISRMKSVEEQIADHDFNLKKQKEYYQDLRLECSKIEQTQQYSKETSNQQHLSVIYYSKVKKLELSTKRQAREEEASKRKYYNSLLQYQNYKNHFEAIDTKIQHYQQKNQEVLEQIQQMLENFKKIKQRARSLHYQYLSSDENEEAFALTQIRRSKIKQEITPSTQQTHQNRYLTNQKRLNQANASSNEKSFVRKWSKPLEGSIIRQQIQLPTKNQQKKLIDLEQQDIRYDDYAKKMRHFKTQSSPNNQRSSFAINSPIHQDSYFKQEQYEQDFET